VARAQKGMEQEMIDEFVRGALVDDPKSSRGHSRVWWGRGKNVHKAYRAKTTQTIKDLCRGQGESSQTTWDNDRKLWGTFGLENVPGLISSGLWEPLGMPPALLYRLALSAQKQVDGLKEEARVKQAAEDAAAQEKGKKTEVEAAAKAALLKERMSMGEGFSSQEVEIALTKYGMSHEVLLATPFFTHLGPSCQRPFTRVMRWFAFRNHADEDIQCVLERDFLTPFRERKERKAQSDREATQQPHRAKRAKKASVEDDAAVFERMQARESQRMQLLHARRRQQEDEAFESKVVNTPFDRKLPFLRSCPLCGVAPIEQFLECGCDDDSCRAWYLCDVCNCTAHTSKFPCYCAAR